MNIFNIREAPMKRMAIAITMLAALPMEAAQAFEFDTGDSDVKIRWDNTFKYSAAYRLKDQSSALDASSVGGLFPSIQFGGDRNFNKGLVSNRLDVLSEFDVTAQNYGMRMSAAAWYDDVYNKSTDSSLTPSFLTGTRVVHGRNIELQDAFVYGKTNIGESGQGTVRLGRHSLVYGESLFFGSNGIANAQGPIDVVKLLSVPGSQFKEILRPVNQVSTQIQINPNVSMGGYYQFEWRRSVVPGAGSYLSSADYVGKGSGPLREVFGNDVVHGRDFEGKNSGQGGLQLRYKPAGTELEFGLYAAQYHDKTPSNVYASIVGFAGGAPVFGEYNQVFAEKIKTVGASLSTSAGSFNFAGEVSFRWNAPLVSNLQPYAPGTNSDNSANALFAKGRTAHANLSTIYLLSPSALWEGGTVLAELAWNRTLSVTSNPGALSPFSTRDATAFRMIFEPAYFQVLDGLDLSVPVGLGVGLDGRSSAVFQGGFGASKAGDWSIGVKGTYRQIWQFGINYVKFFGAEKALLDSGGDYTYGQTLKDRDFISAYLKRTF